MSGLRNYFSFSIYREKLIEKSALDVRDYRLLEYVANNRLQGKAPTVTALINQKQIASPAILHSSLKKMIKKGFIHIELDQEDHRIKYPKLTSKADKFFSDLLKEFSKKSQ